MTKEEAIYKAKHLRKVHPNICIDAEDFWDTVIAALEQEPCTDAISREEAIKPFLVDATEEWTSADIVKYLKSLLSVMPIMRYPQVIGITPIVIPVEEEQGDIQYDNKTTLNRG